MEHRTIKIEQGFGPRELGIAADILNACANGRMTQRAKNAFRNITEICFNASSGYVYAIDEDCSCILMNDDMLDVWYFSPYSENDGFYSDLEAMDKTAWDKEDIDWFNDITKE